MFNTITNLMEEHAGITSTKMGEVISSFSLNARYAKGSDALQQVPWSSGTREDSLFIRSGVLRCYLYC